MGHSIAGRPLARRSLLTAAAALPLVSIRSGPARAAEFSTSSPPASQSLSRSTPGWSRRADAFARRRAGGWTFVSFRLANSVRTPTCSPRFALAESSSSTSPALSFPRSRRARRSPMSGSRSPATNRSGRPWTAISVGQSGRRSRRRACIVVSKAADNSFRQITSAAKPIKTPEDLKGYRIRVPVSPIFTSLFKSLGANPTSINFNELYTALQTHLVDGQENGLVAIESGKLYEVQKYVAAYQPHLGSVLAARATGAPMGRLPEEISGNCPPGVRPRLRRAARGRTATRCDAA